MIKLYKYLSLIILALFLFVSCDDDANPGLGDLITPPTTPASLTSIEPQNGGLAGITILTINGTNFSPVLAYNEVYFNGVKGEILEATTTQLKVKPPIVVSDSVQVKVSVFKVEDFSNILFYKLVSAAVEYYPFDPNNGQIPYGFVFNSLGEMLVSLDNSGIKKITPDKTLSDFIPKGNAQKWDCLKFGPGSELFGSRTINAIWKLVEGIAPASPWVSLSAGIFIKDIDFDFNNNLWGVGAANRIYRFTTAPSTTFFNVTGTFRSARVFDGSLYVAGTKGNTEGVWKYSILPNGELDLTSEQLFFDLTANYTGAQALAITFSADGDLIIGTNKDPDPLIIVYSDGSNEKLYPGIIPAGKVLYIYWPENSTSFYFTREEKKDSGGKIVYSQSIIRVEMLELGAEYYGN